MRSILVLIAFCPFAHGQTLTLPLEVKGEPGSFISIPAKTDGKVVRWVSLDAGLQLFPVELLKDSKTAVATGPAGVYRLLAYTSVKDSPSEPAICRVVIGKPEPKPDDPPQPPDITDPIIAAALAAYQMEFSPSKSSEADGFAKVYRHAATLTRSATTVGKLYEGVIAKVREFGLQGKLPHVQKAISDDLAQRLPNPIDNPGTALDAASRELFERNFIRAAKAWEALP